MIHKFISNDNKGNVNTLEIGSDYTKISKVVDPVNSDDAVNKRYVDQAAGKFIVTLTPTALDYSGTMDHTVAEINAAYEAGQDVWFRFDDGNGVTGDFPLLAANKISGNTYPSFNSQMFYMDNDLLIGLCTGTTDDGTKRTYSTKAYALTPAS